MHCVVTCGPDGVTVRRWAANTLLNGQAFSEAALVAGDSLRVADVEVIVAGVDEPPTDVPEADAHPVEEPAVDELVEEQLTEDEPAEADYSDAVATLPDPPAVPPHLLDPWRASHPPEEADPDDKAGPKSGDTEEVEPLEAAPEVGKQPTDEDACETINPALVERQFANSRSRRLLQALRNEREQAQDAEEQSTAAREELLAMHDQLTAANADRESLETDVRTLSDRLTDAEDEVFDLRSKLVIADSRALELEDEKSRLQADLTAAQAGLEASLQELLQRDQSPASGTEPPEPAVETTAETIAEGDEPNSEEAQFVKLPEVEEEEDSTREEASFEARAPQAEVDLPASIASSPRKEADTADLWAIEPVREPEAKPAGEKCNEELFEKPVEVRSAGESAVDLWGMAPTSDAAAAPELEPEPTVTAPSPAAPERSAGIDAADLWDIETTPPQAEFVAPQLDAEEANEPEMESADRWLASFRDAAEKARAEAATTPSGEVPEPEAVGNDATVEAAEALESLASEPATNAADDVADGAPLAALAEESPAIEVADELQSDEQAVRRLEQHITAPTDGETSAELGDAVSAEDEVEAIDNEPMEPEPAGVELTAEDALAHHAIEQDAAVEETSRAEEEANEPNEADEPVAQVESVDELIPKEQPTTDAPQSFYEKYASMLPADDAEEIVEDEAPQAVAPPSPAETQPAPAGDDSIEDYMAELMRRIRGESDGAAAAPPPKPAPAAKAKPAPTKPADSPEAPPEAKETPLTDLDSMRSAPAPERGRDMSALRALANDSARSAIDVAASKEHKEKALANLAISGMAMGCGGYLAATASAVIDAQFLGGLAGFGWAGYWGYKTLLHMLGKDDTAQALAAKMFIKPADKSVPIAGGEE